MLFRYQTLMSANRTHVKTTARVSNWRHPVRPETVMAAGSNVGVGRDGKVWDVSWTPMNVRAVRVSTLCRVVIWTVIINVNVCPAGRARTVILVRISTMSSLLCVLIYIAPCWLTLTSAKPDADLTSAFFFRSVLRIFATFDMWNTRENW